MERDIKIACQGVINIPLDELVDLQKNLKNLSEDDYVKLRNSMVEFGFSFPVFYWLDGTTKYLIDAHQRVATLKKMRDEGWTIPPLPAVPVFAKDKTEAKKKLLVLNSRYGKVTDIGMTDFLNEDGFEIPFDDISEYLSYPERDFVHKEAEDQEDTPQNNQKDVTCPNCGHKFKPFDKEEPTG